MAEEQHPAESGQQRHQAEARAGGPSRREERRFFGQVRRFMGLADVMAVLMVLATAFSAFATWRTAQVTHQVLLISQRPFLGTQTLTMEPGSDGSAPRIRLDFRNYGHIPATGVVVRMTMLVDGKPAPRVEGYSHTLNAGVVSPRVPHFFYGYLPPDTYQAIISGKSRLLVALRMSYYGPLRRRFCHNEGIRFDRRSGAFIESGGDDICGPQNP